MFNPTTILIDAFAEELVSLYIDMYGENEEDLHRIVSCAHSSLEIIATSDAPYHDMNHTMMVTSVGMEILRGKILLEGNVSNSDWVHFMISLLNHDIGYARGICKADRSGWYTINADMDTIAPPVGATDAFLTPYHVDRGKLYVKDRFASDTEINTDVICANIERTRFPIPHEADDSASDDMPGLLRAADLIGQLADPHYFRKISALYAEFEETGQAAKLGYTTAADLQAAYPRFYWNVVSSYIEDGVRFLQRTQDGQAWVANLYANVFAEEHETPCYGPERRFDDERRVATKSLFTASELTQNDQRQSSRRLTDLDATEDKAD